MKHVFETLAQDFGSFIFYDTTCLASRRVPSRKVGSTISKREILTKILTIGRIPRRFSNV